MQFKFNFSGVPNIYDVISSIGNFGDFEVSESGREVYVFEYTSEHVKALVDSGIDFEVEDGILVLKLVYSDSDLIKNKAVREYSKFMTSYAKLRILFEVVDSFLVFGSPHVSIPEDEPIEHKDIAKEYMTALGAVKFNEEILENGDCEIEGIVDEKSDGDTGACETDSGDAGESEYIEDSE